MSSDEMRVDLEFFVNKGIREGWHGWPLKSQLSCHHEGVRSIYRGMPVSAESSRDCLGQGRFSPRFGGRLGDLLR